MTEYLGYEKNKKLAKQYNNQWVTDTIGGKLCKFRSKIEYKTALYLELLKASGEIKDWNHEFMKFKFPDDSWLVDFTITENDGNFYHYECKGRFEARDRKKIKLLFKYFPEARVLFIFYSKRDIAKVKTAEKFMWWRKPVTLRELTKGIV